jgi:hypothetical protein
MPVSGYRALFLPIAPSTVMENPVYKRTFEAGSLPPRATPTETGLEGGKYRQHGPSYVFSKLLTDSDNYWPGNQTADQFNRRLEKSIGQFDVTHNFKLGGVYDLPFGKEKQFLALAQLRFDRLQLLVI